MAKSKAAKRCPVCGTELKSGQYFCPECGAKVAEPPKEKTKTITVTKKVADKDAVKKARAKGIAYALEFFARAGFDFDSDIDGVYLLLRAAEENDVEMLEALLDVGADIYQTDSDSNTALMKAAESGSNKAAKFLIDRGTDVDAENDYGETALSLARDNGNRYIVGLLRSAGATDNSDD